MKKLVFRVSPELNAESTYALEAGTVTFAAAPFDTPTHIVLSTHNRVLVAEFSYTLGDDEPTTTERLDDGIVAHMGAVSGRVMRLEIPSDAYEAKLKLVEQELRSRQRKEAAIVGQPLRRAAHYGLVGTRVLPAMHDYIAAQLLPDLRRITNH